MVGKEIMLNYNGRCQYQVKDLAEDLAQEEGAALLLVGVEFPDGTYKNLPIYKIIASADDSEVYLCLGYEISND